MIDRLAIKRQQFARRIRRQETQSYMQEIRQRMIRQERQGQKILTDQILTQMMRIVETPQIIRGTMYQFLNELKNYRARSLANPRLLKFVHKILREKLRFKRCRDVQNKDIHDLTKDLLIRIIDQGPLVLEYCFAQLFRILQDHNLELHELWPSAMLIRSQVIFHHGFCCYISYLQQFPQSIHGEINTILKTFSSILLKIQEAPQIRLNIALINNVVEMVQKLINNYELQFQDVTLILQIFNSVYGHMGVQQGVQYLLSTTVYSKIIEYIKKQQNTAMEVLKFLGKSLCVEEQLVYSFVEKFPSLLTEILKVLPVDSPRFQFIKQNLKLRHNNIDLTCQAVFCLANIAASSKCFNLLMKLKVQKILSSVAQLSGWQVLQEINYYFYNLAIKSDESQIQLILQHDILITLQILLCENKNKEIIRYSVKILRIILDKIQHVPDRNMVWAWDKQRTVRQCERLGIVSTLEDYVTIFGDTQISTLANNCLQLMKIQRNQAL